MRAVPKKVSNGTPPELIGVALFPNATGNAWVQGVEQYTRLNEYPTLIMIGGWNSDFAIRNDLAARNDSTLYFDFQRKSSACDHLRRDRVAGRLGDHSGAPQAEVSPEKVYLAHSPGPQQPQNAVPGEGLTDPQRHGRMLAAAQGTFGTSCEQHVAT